MKKAFTLLELIFAVLIMGIIASFAIPKYIDTKDAALASTIKRDIVTATTAIQSYTLLNSSISKMSDALILNTLNWTVKDLKAVFKDGSTDCITLEVKEENDSKVFDITIDSDAGKVCEKLSNNEGIVSTQFILY